MFENCISNPRNICGMFGRNLKLKLSLKGCDDGDKIGLGKATLSNSNSFYKIYSAVPFDYP